MSTSTVTASAADSRSRPLRRLSQLRAYTQSHFAAHSSSSSSSSSPTSRVSRRHTFSSRVPWFSPASSPSSPESPSHIPSAGTSNPAPCSASDHSTPLTRYTSALLPGTTGLDIDLCSVNISSESSNSIPSSESGSSETQETMARLRESSQTPDVRNEMDASSAPASTSMRTGALEPSNPSEAETASSSPKPKQKATIRFFPHQDSHQSPRPSLNFIPVSRTLPSESCVIRVGRYSERDGLPVANPTAPSDAPVGFKSKVVSRKHCEFLNVNGQWHIKDVGSSSGTFLNHMRLSQPNMVSRLYPIKDGDIVQLGIDFRGGEETIFRCVRIRVECNRSWQQQPNEFNKNTESLIKNLGKGDTADYSGCRECSICLGSVLRPYQCLFMAACAHVWHYKCISRLIHTPDYPMFQCPNCRAYTDLSAEVDDTNDVDDKEQKDSAPAPEQMPSSETRSAPEESSNEMDTSQETPEDSEQSSDLPIEPGLAVNVENMSIDGDSASRADTEETPNLASISPEPAFNNVTSAPNTDIDIPGWQSLTPSSSARQPRQAQLRSETPVRSESSDDNPLTPQNDSGPLAFDGRAGMS